MPVFVRGHRRGKAIVKPYSRGRSVIARDLKLAHLMRKTEARISTLTTRGSLRRRNQVAALHNKLGSHREVGLNDLNTKRRKGWQYLHKNSHGGYNIF